MIDKELEVVDDLGDSQISEKFSMAIDSSILQNQNGRSQGAQELQKRLKNLRSIKLSKSPSLKSSRRRARQRSNNHHVCSDAASSAAQSISSDLSTCSETSTENLQNSTRTITRRSSFKPVRNLTRISSLKFKNPSMRKSSGGTQMNNLKKSRMAGNPANSESSRPSARQKKSGHVGLSAISSSDTDSASSTFSKETCSSNGRKKQFQASPHTSESSFCSSIETRKRSVFSKPNSTSAGQKSPLNASTKLARAKSKKCSMRKHSEQISQLPDLSVQRATCSSALKGSKSPDIRGLQAEGTESEGISGTKVCPFTYCSLHGHRHASVPPLKRLISIRRRMLKTQRSVTPATQPLVRVKRSGKVKEDQTNQMICNGHGAVHETTSPVVEKLSREMSLEIYAEPEPEAKPSGIGTYSENGENNDDFSNISEKLLGETSIPHIALEESLHTVEQHALVSLSAPDGLSPECCCTGTAFEATNTDRKEEKIAASNHNEGAQSTCTNSLSNIDPKSIEKSMAFDDCAAVKPPHQLERAIPDEVVESTTDNEHNEISSSDCQALEEKIAANENKNGSVQPESNPKKATNVAVAHSVQSKDHKYIRMWQLMYKHAVKGPSASVENQLSLGGLDKEEQVEGTNTVFETNNLSFTETDEHTALINHSGGDQNIELCHHDAIKLVQDAFDNILLPEVQDRAYDDQSFTNGISSDQEALGQSQDECGEQSTSRSSHSSEDSKVQNPEETWAKAETISSRKEEKAVSKGDKTDKKTPKSWSSLKKFILLKRFVKAVEKVRNLNYQKPQYLPLDPDSEAEKVNLRQQKTEERKNAEEWMLDYALQQVISKLPPAQQRRVALLVEAFETVIPFPEIKTSHRSSAIESTEADLQVCNGFSVLSADHRGKECDSGISAEILGGNMSGSEKSFNEYPAQARDVQLEHQQSPANFSKLKEPSTDHCFIKTERIIAAPKATNEDQKGNQIVFLNTDDGDDKAIVGNDIIDFTNVSLSETKDPRSCDEAFLKQDEHGSTIYEGLVNDTIEEASKEVTSITSLELSNLNSKVENIKLETSSIKPTEEPMAAREEVRGGATPESGLVEGFPPLEESHLECDTSAPHEIQLEKQKYTNLWFLVYKHMVSSIDAKDGDEFLDRAEEEQADDANRLPGIDNKKIELRHIEAIKQQVEKAIDDIILPENQDESDDNKSITRGFPDHEPPENQVDIQGKSFISTFSSAKSDNATIQEEEKAVAKVEEKPNKKMSKNWSNLKKMILLNRFIKALENVKRFNPRGPRYLPLEPDLEADRVHLKHQNMDGRKNSEEWMLDYALQQAVSRLTPARKRKVSLLVEAFETVIPSNGIPNPFKPQATH
ncbi:hypothetical protein PRUPE_7G047600 [Prunus persica]|uniref:Calmodulin-binding domain-containing protein n=1 Tax=Prunus persica TaxID=3760 RepID=A0A251N6Q9_PRUPE|nr:hypothetical protein PRUPE_7G047600 [Prunus persica]